MTRSLAGHRAPFVVTFSLATLTPCCQSERRVTPPHETPPRPGAGVADTPGAAASSAPPPATASASARVSTKVWPFDEDPNLVNPRAGGKAILYFETCYTLGEEDEATSGIQFEQQPVDCPQGIETLLANCMGKLLTREGDVCWCGSPEGNPPMPAKTVPCPR